MKGRDVVERIRSRGIRLEVVMEVLAKPDRKFFDVEEDTIVYISVKNRLIAVATPGTHGELRVVTVIPALG